MSIDDRNLSDRLLTTEQVSQRYGFSVNKLKYDRFKNRGFPYVKIGGRVRYSPQIIEATLRECLIEPESKN